jgi:hypothetical protein
MRCFMMSLGVLLALMAFNPTPATAKDPGSSGGGRSEGGHSGHGEQHGDRNVGGGAAVVNPGADATFAQPRGVERNSRPTFDAHNTPEFSGGAEGRESWRYRWDNGRWWFWTPQNRWMRYGNDGRWMDYGNAYVVQRPILENYSGDPIKIVNPAKNGVTLSYLLNGVTYTIPPGYSQDLRADREWVIQFSRCASLDQTQYGLQSGLYRFTNTDHGWDLYRSDFP